MSNQQPSQTMKNWFLGLGAAVTMSLLAWIGVSNLQSLAFQSALTPQIESIATSTEKTAEDVQDIKLEMTGFATKKELASEVKRMESMIRELELELVEFKVKAGLD